MLPCLQSTRDCISVVKIKSYFCSSLGNLGQGDQGANTEISHRIQMLFFSASLLNSNPVFLTELIPHNPRVQFALVSALPSALVPEFSRARVAAAPAAGPGPRLLSFSPVTPCLLEMDFQGRGPMPVRGLILTTCTGLLRSSCCVPSSTKL